MSGASPGQPDGGATGTGPGTGDFPTCPDRPPIAGSTCESPNSGCAYFTNGACEAFLCDATAHWQASSEGC